MKKIVALLLVLVMAFAFVACDKGQGDGGTTPPDAGQEGSDGGDPAEKGGTIKIAVASPMTGPLAEYGLGFYNASELMVKQWNDKGGVKVGDVYYDIELLKYDDVCEADQAVVIADEIVSDPDIWCVIGHFASGVCMAASPTYEEAQYVNISPSASQREFTLDNEYIFRNNVVVMEETLAGAEIAAVDLGCTKIGILSIDTEWGLTTGNTMEENLAKLGVTDITRLECASGQSDMATEVSKFKAAGVECIMVAGEYDTLAPLALASKNSDFNVYFVGCSNAYTESLLEIAGDAAEGIYAPVSFFAGNPDPAIQVYVEEFKAAYGAAPSALTTHAYDSVGLFLEAVERAGVLDRVAIMEAMYETDYNGMSGHTTFNEEGDATKEFTKIMVKNGEFVVAEF